jgi:hypothetical protein
VPANTEAMLFFMTDGEPTEGERDPSKIRQNVNSQNNWNNKRIPIHGLAFGGGADFALVKSISDQSGGKSAK